jgi:UDP-N-acetylglucosamine 2-epimerase (non-hydrolysing)
MMYNITSMNHTQKTVMTITGIRPDFIRMSEIFRKLDETFNHILVHTGQHYDKLLSDVFFADMDIRPPDYNLQVGGDGKKHYHQQAELGVKIIELLETEKIAPDIILLLGDSNSVLVSVPLKKEGYKIGHIEAGMRSYDDRMLEEINRKVCDHVSDFLFVYHENYKQKALREGISEKKIFVVGNTVVEPLRKIADLTYKGNNSHILLDIHRPENFKYKERMAGILKFAHLCSVRTGKTIKMLKFGRTIKSMQEHNLDLGKIELVELMGYKKFIRLMQDSLFIISDSGTSQEEPALLDLPVIVPRDFTERPESVENNNSFMLNINEETCYIDAINWASSDRESSAQWLGDGDTSEKIISILQHCL